MPRMHDKDRDVMKYCWMMLVMVSVALAAGCGGVRQMDPGMRDIDAAAKLDMDTEKSLELTKIARRTDLTAEAQVHLVDTAFDKLVFDDPRMDVLIALIQNRGFCRDAKARILDRIGELTSMDVQRDVLNAMDRRGEPKQ